MSGGLTFGSRAGGFASLILTAICLRVQRAAGLSFKRATCRNMTVGV